MARPYPPCCSQDKTCLFQEFSLSRSFKTFVAFKTTTRSQPEAATGFTFFCLQQEEFVSFIQ